MFKIINHDVKSVKLVVINNKTTFIYIELNYKLTDEIFPKILFSWV